MCFCARVNSRTPFVSQGNIEATGKTDAKKLGAQSIFSHLYRALQTSANTGWHACLSEGAEDNFGILARVDYDTYMVT